LTFATMAHAPGTAAAAVAAGYVAGLVVSLAVNGRPDPVDAAGPSVPVDGWMLGSVLADQVSISADTFLLAALRSTAAAGIYAAVYRIPNAWMTLVGLAMLGMIAPISRRMNTASRSEARALQMRSLRLGLAGAGAILVSAIPVFVLVPVVFGHAYTSGRTPLLVLMAATAVMAVGASLHPLYFALARDRDIFTLAVAGALVNLGLNLVAIPLWGMIGAAFVTFVAQVFLLALIVVRLRTLVCDEQP
jgi:O-antigen/teichoic acid export membrane protein